MKGRLFKSLLAFVMVVTTIPATNVNAAPSTVTGTYTQVPVTDGLKETIDRRVEMGKDYKSAVEGTIDEETKTISLNIALVDVCLDNSEYKNGKSPAGESFFNLLEFYADALQTQTIIQEHNDYTVKDVNGNEISQAYIDTLVSLIDDVYNLNPYTNLQYRQASIEGEEGYNSEDLYGGVDVIATSDDGTVTFTFHMDHHGFWGYELAGDTFMDDVIGIKRSEENQIRALNTAYGNFMKIRLPELEGKEGNFNWYLFNNTDLENPYMYIGTNSEGVNEALLIDVDFYGEHVINDVIKAAIIETYGSVEVLDTLYIYLTHLHGEHVNNLQVINEDEELRDKVKLIWPEAEVHPTLNDRDLITLFDYEDVEGKVARESRVINLADNETITILNHEFKLLSIPDQHTNGGSGLADTNMGIYYSGDTLGSQIHLGGTSIFTRTGELTQGWLDSMGKTVAFMEENNLKYIMTGHSPYPIHKDYTAWMGASIDYIAEQLEKDPTFSGLVVVENGQVLNGTERFGEIFAIGLTDKEVFAFASVNFMNFYKPEEKPETPTGPSDSMQTGDSTNFAPFIAMVGLSVLGAVAVVVLKKKEENMD